MSDDPECHPHVAPGCSEMSDDSERHPRVVLICSEWRSTSFPVAVWFLTPFLASLWAPVQTVQTAYKPSYKLLQKGIQTVQTVNFEESISKKVFLIFTVCTVCIPFCSSLYDGLYAVCTVCTYFVDQRHFARSYTRAHSRRAIWVH